MIRPPTCLGNRNLYNALHQEVAGVLERGQPLEIGARGGRVARARRLPAQGIVRPLVVVQRPKAIEGALLGGERRTRGATGASLEGLVHPLVRPVLLGRGGVNALMLDPEAHPPDVELREAMDATRREGDAVVGPDGPRQAELAEGVLEDRAGAPALDARQPSTGEQIARVLIGNRERVAPHPIARYGTKVCAGAGLRACSCCARR